MVVDYTTLHPYIDHDRILSNDTPGKLSRINGDSREETFFDFAPLFLPGHWNEDIVPAAGDHRQQARRQKASMRIPRKKKGLILGP